MTEARDEFYVGYLDRAPPALGRWLRRHVRDLLVFAVLLAVILATSQRPFAVAVFEFGHLTTHEGVLIESPSPQLRLAVPSSTASVRYDLVAEGKHGADGLVSGLEGQRARVTGTLIYRDGRTLIEVAEGGIEVMAADSGSIPSGQGSGRLTVRGEIVDAKCFGGVMNPGQGKPHKACAIRCLSGGIPPVIVTAADGGLAAYLLVDREGGALGEAILDYVAEPVEVEGLVVDHDGLATLRIDPRDIRRIGGPGAADADG